MKLLLAFFNSLLNHLTNLLLKDKSATDATTPEDMRRRWDNHVRDSLRDD
ncbi:MAG: hypothetical protein GKR97_10120 [Rhizobiaceae bacterium]|jgi:hypothetical protein|nr:hypothetical protein [Rhizobiaceae bacterium]